MKEAYSQGLESDMDEDGAGDLIKPRDVGHNIYILAHQVTEQEKKNPMRLFLIQELVHFYQSM